jgi:N4-gp56 family major capsid protein|nr:MAG TPA: capsid protein [Caudoviricetes sp.]
MAINTNATKLAELINPEVMGAFAERKLEAEFKFAPLAVVGHELQGQAGDTLTIPVWGYIGKAEDVEEGAPIPISKMGQTKTTVKVKKAGKGIELTDEAVLSGLGDAVGEGEKQLAESILDKVNKDCFDALMGTTTLQHTTTGALNADEVADALVHFKEDVHEGQVLFVSPKRYAQLRKDPAWVTVLAGEKFISGQVGEIMGCSVVVSNTVEDDKALIVRAGALGLELKRDTMIETDRDIIHKSTIVTIDKHYVAYLKDASKVIKVTISE